MHPACLKLARGVNNQLVQHQVWNLPKCAWDLCGIDPAWQTLCISINIMRDFNFVALGFYHCVWFSCFKMSCSEMKSKRTEKKLFISIYFSRRKILLSFGSFHIAANYRGGGGTCNFRKKQTYLDVCDPLFVTLYVLQRRKKTTTFFFKKHFGRYWSRIIGAALGGGDPIKGNPKKNCYLLQFCLSLLRMECTIFCQIHILSHVYFD